MSTNEAYKNFVRGIWDGDASFAGGVSDMKLDKVIQTIWNGKLDKKQEAK